MSSNKPSQNQKVPSQQDKDNQPGIHDSQFGQPKKPGQQHQQQSTPQQQPGQHSQVEQNVDPQRQRPHNQQQK